LKKISKIISLLIVIALVFSLMPISAIVSASGNSTTTTIINPKVESTVNPVGIDVTTPRFSWEMNSEVTGQLQTKYQIIVSTTAENLAANIGDAWDSGVVTSAISNNVQYNGTALLSRLRYFWKVNVYDKDGTIITSENSYFEMGLLDKSLWNGQFIAANGINTGSQVPAYTLEVKFHIVNSSAGVIFGGNNGQFLMWQINISNYASSQKVYFRPHNWNPGGACIAEIDITNVIPWADRLKDHTMKIVVSSNNDITTYVDDIKIDERNNSLAKYGQVGFRECPAADVSESASFSKFLITTPNGDTLFNADFSTGRNPFNVGSIVKNPTTNENELLVPPISGDIYMQSTDGNNAPMFRKDFALLPGKTVKSARLYASALGVYDAYINGNKVSNAVLSPGDTDYLTHVMYQTYDITNMLNATDNTVGAIVGNGWYSGHISGSSNDFGSDVAFLGQTEITYTDGTIQIIGTDNTWKITTKGPYVSTDNQNGETYDATLEMPGWAAPGFNESAWRNSIIALKTTINTKVDITNLKYVAQVGPLVMPQDEFAVKTMTEPTAGTYIIDIGQNISGFVKLTIKGGKAGDTVKIRYGEKLWDSRAGALNGTLYTENLRSALATDYYTKKGTGDEVYEPRFTFHGFQYMEITNYPGVLNAADVKGVFVGSDTTAVGSYNTSNALVNQLYSNTVWSQRDNFLSIPTDCPQRDERM
jgi:hypothetical protein